MSLSPVKPCHLLTAKRRLAVTVMMAGDVRPGWGLAATRVTGELDGNFSTMMTSCCICSVNISGVCRRRYCSGPQDGQRGRGEERRHMEQGRQKKSKNRKKDERRREAAAAGVSEEKKTRREREEKEGQRES